MGILVRLGILLRGLERRIRYVSIWGVGGVRGRGDIWDFSREGRGLV